jgi:hypothetical protein
MNGKPRAAALIADQDSLRQQKAYFERPPTSDGGTNGLPHLDAAGGGGIRPFRAAEGHFFAGIAGL